MTRNNNRLVLFYENGNIVEIDDEGNQLHEIRGNKGLKYKQVWDKNWILMSESDESSKVFNVNTMEALNSSEVNFLDRELNLDVKESGEIILVDALSGKKLEIMTEEKIYSDVDGSLTHNIYKETSRPRANGSAVFTSSFILPTLAKDDPEWLYLSLEVRSGYTWDKRIKNIRSMKEEEFLTKWKALLILSQKRNKEERLIRKAPKFNFRSTFCDVREWSDLSQNELDEMAGKNKTK